MTLIVFYAPEQSPELELDSFSWFFILTQRIFLKSYMWISINKEIFLLRQNGGFQSMADPKYNEIYNFQYIVFE